MEIGNALRDLAAVSTISQGLLPQVAGNDRNIGLARHVSGAFNEYKLGLSALNVPSDMSGLTKNERGFVGRIAESARVARANLSGGSNDVFGP